MKSFFKAKGFNAHFVPIHWDRKVMSDYVVEFEEYYVKHKTEKNYVLGFSFGAMIAFISAQQLQPDRLYLCSLSPYFKEDLHTLKSYWRKFIGKNRVQDFKKVSAKQIATQVKIPITIFYGGAEAKKYPQLKVRCEKTSKDIKNAKLVFVKDAPHQLNHPNYIEAIKKQF